MVAKLSSAAAGKMQSWVTKRKEMQSLWAMRVIVFPFMPIRQKVIV